MGRKEKSKSKAVVELHDDQFTGASTPSLVFSSDEDEANQDLSLKIVEKAMRMREAKCATPSDHVSLSQTLEFAVARNVVPDVPSAIADSEVKEKKKTTKLKIDTRDERVEEMEETIKDTENQSAEGGAVQTVDNMVLRKLLRGPRYFDPPNDSWGACFNCFNCGEEGHAAVNCSVAKRKKPCYVCGVLGHNAKQCTKTQDCFICKKGGHRARDCPEKHASTPRIIAICLKCGNSGHDMFGCKNDYSLDDLQEIQCYVCKRLGHLCCVNSDDATPGEISCYKCGRLGHTGLACSRLQDEIASGATPSSCFKCGEEGHFARECTSAVKTGKRSRDSSRTKDKRSHKENDYIGNRSAPNDMGVARRKKRLPTEERGGFSLPKKSKSRGGWMQEHPAEERGFTTPKKSNGRGGWTTEHPAEHKGYTTPKKSKSRGGWTTEHPEEFFPPMAMRNSYRFSGSPYSRSTTIHSFGSGSHTPGYKSNKIFKYDFKIETLEREIVPSNPLSSLAHRLLGAL